MKGFTLIELLVVVLIIGILAAVALPVYERAVWKSRAVPLQVWASKVWEAEELYFMANGRYTQCLDRLDLDYKSAFPVVVSEKSGWFDGGAWADNCVISVSTENESPGMILSAGSGVLRAVFQSGKYALNGFGGYIGHTDAFGGLWGTCSTNSGQGWSKILRAMGYNRVVMFNYVCYQQLNK